MTGRYRVIILLLITIFNYSFSRIPDDDKDGINKIRNNNITKEEILQHIKYLSSDLMEGRFPGTKEDSLTESYIVSEFKHYNLMPFAENSYLQPFQMITQMQLKENNKLQIVQNGKTESLQTGKDFIPLGFSGNGRAEGNIVFAGYGITAPDQNYDDYRDRDGNEIDVNGKILIVLRYSPGGINPHTNPFQKYEALRYKALKARDTKASAIIIVNEFNTGDDKLIELNYDNAPQNAGIPVINCKREMVENIFNTIGLNLTSIQSEIDSTKKSNSFELKNTSAIINTQIEPVKVITHNVLGFIEGNDPDLKNEVIVIGAHKDHLGYGLYGSLYTGADKQIHNGADDNASGVAGLLEIAQKVSSQKEDLKRSILFIAFGGEEAGLLGSEYFTKSGLFHKLKIDAMINMDMIGRLSDNKLIIYGTGTSAIWNNLLDSLNKQFNFIISKIPDGLGPSDHSSFYLKNIPVLQFFSGAHKDYHTPTDDYEKINSGGEERIANFVYEVGMTLDEIRDKPGFIKVAARSNENPSLEDIRVYVGTIPDYSAAEEGMKLSGVREGSPAEKGGLKGEDVIIKFGDKDVRNIYDYMYAMNEHKPGEEVEIIVLRDKKMLTLKVILGSR